MDIHGKLVPALLKSDVGKESYRMFTGEGSTLNIDNIFNKVEKVLKTTVDEHDNVDINEVSIDEVKEDYNTYYNPQLWKIRFKEFAICCGEKLVYHLFCKGGKYAEYLEGTVNKLNIGKLYASSSAIIGKKVDGFKHTGHWLDNRVAEGLKDFVPPFKIVREEIGEFVSINGRKGKRAIVVADINGKEFKCGKTQLKLIGLG